MKRTNNKETYNEEKISVQVETNLNEPNNSHTKSPKSIWNNYKKLNLISKFLLGILLFIILVLIYIGLSPLNTIKEYENLVKADSVFQQKYDSIYDAPELKSLIHQKAYKESLVGLLKEDSIYLIVNLHDSLISLSINGVTIHSYKYQEFENDLLLEKLSNKIYLNLFSENLHVISENATIVKEPIVVRHAPKDEAEAALNVYMPDTLIQNPAFLRLELNNQITLLFFQDSIKTFNDKCVRIKFILNNSSFKFKNYLTNFFTFNRAIYNPTISIKIPADELRSIYRALPNNAKVVLYF